MATKKELAELELENYDITMLKIAIEKGTGINEWLNMKERVFKNMQRRACVFIKEDTKVNN